MNTALSDGAEDVRLAGTLTGFLIGHVIGPVIGGPDVGARSLERGG